MKRMKRFRQSYVDSYRHSWKLGGNHFKIWLHAKRKPILMHCISFV